MLHYLSFSNFCSFGETSVLDLRVSEGAPETGLIGETSTDGRVSKVMALIGPNGAGKTNALRALSFLAFFVRDSFRVLKPENEIPVDRFLFRQDRSTPIEFELEIDTDGVDYRYTCSLLPDRVLAEKLEVRGESGRYRSLIRRQEQALDIGRSGIGVTAASLKPMLRSNGAVLSVLYQQENPITAPFLQWFARFVSNTTRYYSIRPQSPGWSSLEAAEIYEENRPIFDRALEILTDADLGLKDVVIRKEKLVDPESGNQREFTLPYGVHEIAGSSYELPFSLESDGTEALFVLLARVLPVLESGGCAVINDLETDLHPDILPTILYLFVDEETNPHNAQLIFSTHAHEFVFSRLDKRMITLVEKIDGLSSLYRLDSLEGVRTDVDLHKKYRAGAFGAVPNI